MQYNCFLLFRFVYIVNEGGPKSPFFRFVRKLQKEKEEGGQRGLRRPRGSMASSPSLHPPGVLFKSVLAPWELRCTRHFFPLPPNLFHLPLPALPPPLPFIFLSIVTRSPTQSSATLKFVLCCVRAKHILRCI